MTFDKIVCGALAATALIASAPQAGAAQVFATSYDLANGSGSSLGIPLNFWDADYNGIGATHTDASALRIGTGDLTDGVIATGSWDMVEGVAGSGPYVGWYSGLTLNPLLTFHFDELTVINQIILYVDNTGWGNVFAPSHVLIDGVDTAFSAPAEGTVGSIAFSNLNLTGGSHTIELTHRNGAGWVFASEIAFIGVTAVPEASTWAMMLAGFGLVGGALRYRRRRTAVSFA